MQSSSPWDTENAEDSTSSLRLIKNSRLENNIS